MRVVVFWINHGDKPITERQNEIFIKSMKQRGSVLVFPSFLFHKVELVTFGTRYSLVNWILGDTLDEAL